LGFSFQASDLKKRGCPAGAASFFSSLRASEAGYRRANLQLIVNFILRIKNFFLLLRLKNSIQFLTE
jgi:hypothetical protein